MQQEEIRIFVQEMSQGKEHLSRQLESQMQLFKKYNSKALDSQHFSHITRGQHVSTTLEERFDEVSAIHYFPTRGTLLY